MSIPPGHATPAIHLYCELLLNINAVSLHGSISAADNTESTSVSLQIDGPLLRVTHGDSTAALRLPINVISATSTTVDLPAGKAKEFTARLAVNPQDLSSPLALREDAGGDVPWGAKDLSSDSRVYCGGCGHAIVSGHQLGQVNGDVVRPQISGPIQAWKDLPSENWAEMMDFWHCHKPVDHKKADQNGDAASQKGYAASNALQAVPGVGLVDVSNFLVSPDDVAAVQVSD